MVNKKLTRILGPVLGIMGFIVTIGVTEVTVFAESNVQASSIQSESTTSAAVTYKDCSIDINKSQTQKGIKVTVDKAIATKHKLKVTLKIESEISLETIKHGNSILMLTYGENDNERYTHENTEKIDDNTMFLTLEKDNYEGEYPKKGEIRVDVVLSNYKVNIGMDIPVDFTEAFNNILKKDISGKIPEFDYTLIKMESDLMGTRIIYNEPKRGDDKDNKSDSLFNSVMILKAGDKMYKTESSGNYMGKDEVISGDYEVKSLTYDKVKEEKNISIIPLICDISDKDLQKIYSKDNENQENTKTETTNNVSYEKTIDFIDGTKGEIYNIERNDNSIKIYCKGASEKESILMVSNMYVGYQYIKEEKNHDFYKDDNISFYKDPKEAFGYVIELDNVKKDRIVELSFDNLIKYVDRYKLEDEIKLGK